MLTVAVSPRIFAFYFPTRAVKLDLKIQKEHKKECFIHLSNPWYFCFLSFSPCTFLCHATREKKIIPQAFSFCDWTNHASVLRFISIFESEQKMEWWAIDHPSIYQDNNFILIVKLPVSSKVQNESICSLFNAVFFLSSTRAKIEEQMGIYSAKFNDLASYDIN